MVGFTDDYQYSNGYALEFFNGPLSTGMRYYGIFSKRIEDNTTAVSPEKCRLICQSGNEVGISLLATFRQEKRLNHFHG